MGVPKIIISIEIKGAEDFVQLKFWLALPQTLSLALL